MFNDQLREKLKQYLAAEMVGPLPPGSNAVASEGLTRLKDLIVPAAKGIWDEIGADANKPGPGINYGLPPEPPEVPPTPPTTPAMPPVAARPAIPAALPPVTPSPVAQPQSAMPQTDAVVQPTLGSKYDDAARQQLYAQLAEKRKENAGWAAAGSLGDMAMRMGGNTPIGTQQNILAQGNKEDQVAREQFEAGKKGQLEDVSTNLALKKAGREEQEYQDQNNAGSQMSKLAVGLGAQFLGPEKTRQMGWQPGKTTYADVIKVLPIMEKEVALRAAQAAKAESQANKQDNFNSTLTGKLRREIQEHPAYKNYLTVKGMSDSVRQAVQNPSAAGDLSIIYATVKGLDPSSVVREGEIKLLQEVASIKNQIIGKTQNWATGQPLAPEQKQDVMRLMNRLEQISKENVKTLATPVLNQARRSNLSLDEIDPLFSESAAAATSAPKPLSGGWKVVR